MRLNHVTLIASEFDRSIAFYTELGLAPIVIEEPRYVRFTLPNGDETISLEVTGEAMSESRVQLYLECRNLDALCEELTEQGFKFEQPPTDMDYLWREARLRDPDGHQLRLYRADRN